MAVIAAVVVVLVVVWLARNVTDAYAPFGTAGQAGMGGSATASATPRPTTTGSVTAGPGDGRRHPGCTCRPKRERHPSPLPRARPYGLEIPAIGVRSDHLRLLRLDDRGRLTIPRDRDEPAWYTLGPAPGQIGRAVVVGRAGGRSDSAVSDSAVFSRLGDVRPRDKIVVRREDGFVAYFKVYAVGSFQNDGFPRGLVYGQPGKPQLRLITYGGAFKKRKHEPRVDVIVFARLSKVVRPGGAPPSAEPYPESTTSAEPEPSPGGR